MPLQEPVGDPSGAVGLPLSVLKPHSLQQFMESSKSRPYMSISELKQHYIAHQTFQNRLETAQEVDRLTTARVAILRGKTFTEYLNELKPKSVNRKFEINPTVDSKAVHAYAAVGGTLLKEEQTAANRFGRPSKWNTEVSNIANETEIPLLRSRQQFHQNRVLHYEQHMYSNRSDMGKLLNEHGSFLALALLGAFLGYQQGESKQERLYRSALGAVEGTLPYLSLTDFVDNMGIQLLPQEKQEIHTMLFGNRERVHFQDFTKHDPVTNLLLDVLPWGMERRKQDFELTMAELNAEEERLAEEHRTTIDIGKYVSRRPDSKTIVNRRTGIKYHQVNIPP